MLDDDFYNGDDGDGFDAGYDWTDEDERLLGPGAEDDGQPSDLQEHEDFEQADEYFGMFASEDA